MRRNKPNWKNWQNYFGKITKSFNAINSYFLIFIFPILIFIISKAHETKIFWILIIILISLLLLVMKPKAFMVAMIVSIIYLLLTFLKKEVNYEQSFYEIQANVVKANNKYLLINLNGSNCLVFSNSYVTSEIINQGEYISLTGKLVKIEDHKILKMNHLFYLSNNIKYIMEKATITRVYHFHYDLKNEINYYAYRQGFLFENFWRLFVFGYYENKVNIVDKTIKLNIVHLIVISGLHFDVLFFFLFQIFKKLNFKTFKGNYLIYVLIFFYITFLFNPISAWRAYIMQIFKKENRVYKFKPIFKKYDSLVFASFIIFLFNPNNVFSLSFIISFSSTFFIMFLYSYFSKVKKMAHHKFLIAFLISVLVYFLILPITINLNQQINIFGFFYAFALAPIFEFVYLSSILFWFSPIFLSYLYYALDQVLNFLIYISVFVPTNFNFTYLVICIYYLLIYTLCFTFGYYQKSKKAAFFAA